MRGWLRLVRGSGGDLLRRSGSRECPLSGAEGGPDGPEEGPAFVDLRVGLLHRSVDGEVELDAGDESYGTLVWFGLIGLVVESPADGTVLLADKLDASLHPALVAELVRLFQDPAIGGEPRWRVSAAARRRELLLSLEGLTEETYLVDWHRRHRDQVQVTIDPYHTSPLQLVGREVNAKKDETYEARRGKGKAHDQVWCGFDRDEHPRFASVSPYRTRASGFGSHCTSRNKPASSNAIRCWPAPKRSFAARRSPLQLHLKRLSIAKTRRRGEQSVSTTCTTATDRPPEAIRALGCGESSTKSKRCEQLNSSVAEANPKVTASSRLAAFFGLRLHR